MKELTVKEIQKRIFDNKIKKGFNTTDLSKEFLYLTEELGEAVRAYRRDNKDELAEEIVDLVIYCLGMMEMLGKDGIPGNKGWIQTTSPRPKVIIIN
jgi:NTP pyrophosphatase (non-canonical NTP hydrolase)